MPLRLVGKLQRQSHRLFVNDEGVLCRSFRSSNTQPVTQQIVVPLALQRTVLVQLHDHSGHCGVLKTMGKVKERFYWLGYERAVEHFVKSCRVCQLRKSPNPTTTAPVGEIKSFYPFEWLSWDITG